MSNNKLTYMNLIKIIISLLIIIILLIYIFIKIYETNNIAKFINDMQLLEEKISNIKSEYLLWENYNPNESGNFSSYLQSKNFVNANGETNIYKEEFEEIIKELNNNSPSNWNAKMDQILSNYCYFNPNSILENFNIKNSRYYIIINFYTGNIICKNGVKYNRKIFYRHYDLIHKPELNNYQDETIPQLEIVQNNGLSMKLKISLGNNENVPNISEIYYLIDENDEDKKRCTELADYKYVTEEKNAYFTITTSGKYEFIVEDTNYIQYPKINIDINLCNKPILEIGMHGIYFDENNNEISVENIFDKNWYNYSENDFRPAYSKKDDGSYWIWIPRFTYKQIQNDFKIDFVYNSSTISTTNRATINYNIPQIFENELSGIWINEKNLNYYNIESTNFFKKVLTNQSK